MILIIYCSKLLDHGDESSKCLYVFRRRVRLAKPIDRSHDLFSKLDFRKKKDYSTIIPTDSKRHNNLLSQKV